MFETIVHLVYQPEGSTITFSPDPQNAQPTSKFVCGRRYRGCNDLITSFPDRVNCLECLDEL